MKAQPIPVGVLVRVSTSKQEATRQVTELRSYAESKGYEVVEVCEEQISGMAEESARQELHRVEELARAGAIQKVLVHEVSRLARRNSVVHAFVKRLEELGVRSIGISRASRHFCRAEVHSETGPGNC